MINTNILNVSFHFLCNIYYMFSLHINKRFRLDCNIAARVWKKT